MSDKDRLIDNTFLHAEEEEEDEQDEQDEQKSSKQKDKYRKTVEDDEEIVLINATSRISDSPNDGSETRSGGVDNSSGGGVKISSGCGVDISSGGGGKNSSDGGVNISSGGGGKISSGGGVEISSGEVNIRSADFHGKLYVENAAFGQILARVDVKNIDSSTNAAASTAAAAAAAAAAPEANNERWTIEEQLKNDILSRTQKSSQQKIPAPNVLKAKARLARSQQKVVEWLEKRGNFSSNANDPSYSDTFASAEEQPKGAASKKSQPILKKKSTPNTKQSSPNVKQSSPNVQKSAPSVKQSAPSVKQSQRFAENPDVIHVPDEESFEEESEVGTEETWLEDRPKGLTHNQMNILVAVFGSLAAIVGIILIVFFAERPKFEKFPSPLLPTGGSAGSEGGGGADARLRL